MIRFFGLGATGVNSCGSTCANSRHALLPLLDGVHPGHNGYESKRLQQTPTDLRRECSWGDLEDGILEFTGLKRHIVDGARLSLRVFRFQEVFVVEGSEDDIPK